MSLPPCVFIRLSVNLGDMSMCWFTAVCMSIDASSVLYTEDMLPCGGVFPVVFITTYCAKIPAVLIMIKGRRGIK